MPGKLKSLDVTKERLCLTAVVSMQPFIGRSPPQSIKIPATTVPAFSAGKLFKEKVAPAKEEKPAEEKATKSKTKAKK